MQSGCRTGEPWFHLPSHAIVWSIHCYPPITSRQHSFRNVGGWITSMSSCGMPCNIDIYIIADYILLLLLLLLLLFVWGKGGKCIMHHNALRRRVWDSGRDGLPVGLLARLDKYSPVLPTKTPLQTIYYGTGHISKNSTGSGYHLQIYILDYSRILRRPFICATETFGQSYTSTLILGSAPPPSARSWRYVWMAFSMVSPLIIDSFMQTRESTGQINGCSSSSRVHSRPFRNVSAQGPSTVKVKRFMSRGKRANST